MAAKKKGTELTEQDIKETVLKGSETDINNDSQATEPDLNEILIAIDIVDDEIAEVLNQAEEEQVPAKPKRSSRKKSAETTGIESDVGLSAVNQSDSGQIDVDQSDIGQSDIDQNDIIQSEADPLFTEDPAEDIGYSEAEGQGEADSMESSNITMTDSEVEAIPEQIPAESVPERAPAEPKARMLRHPAKSKEMPILTIENRGEVETPEAREEVIWHEIHNAYRTRRMLTGRLGGIETTDSGKTIVVADYKGFRIVIPMKEMMMGRSPSGQEYAELMQRQNKILGNMLGAEIDFIVKGIDSKTRSVVASRQEAMLKKRQIFYMDTDASGMSRVYENRIVEARIIAVAEKVVRVEVFGVECSIMARDLAWDWIGDAHERFCVGNSVLVRILSVKRDDLEELSIKADIKSVTQNTNQENLKKCRIQSKYAGTITDVHKGVVYIRLNNGVNAVGHACYDYRTPGKKDEVSFAVTRIDEERGIAVGIITRIIRQQL